MVRHVQRLFVHVYSNENDAIKAPAVTGDTLDDDNSRLGLIAAKKLRTALNHLTLD